MRWVVIQSLMALTCWGLAINTAGASSSSLNAGHNNAHQEADLSVETVAQFNRPWSMAFMPDNKMLVTEKPGKLYLVDAHGSKTPVSGVPSVYNQGQNGLLDIALA